MITKQELGITEDGKPIYTFLDIVAGVTIYFKHDKELMAAVDKVEADEMDQKTFLTLIETRF